MTSTAYQHTYRRLQAIVAEQFPEATWTEPSAIQRRVQVGPAILIFWRTTGTVQVQGRTASPEGEALLAIKEDLGQPARKRPRVGDQDAESYFLYHVTTDPNSPAWKGGYETYASMIVAATSEGKARGVHPTGTWIQDVPDWCRSWPRTEAECACLRVMRLGTADDAYIKRPWLTALPTTTRPGRRLW